MTIRTLEVVAHTAIRRFTPVQEMLISTAALVAALSTWSGTATAQSRVPSNDPSPHSEIALIGEHKSVRPGTRATVALRVTMDAGWHTYWTNAGDAGFAIAAQWKAPAGVTISALQLPTPKLLPQPPLMSYGYEDELVVLADVDVPASTPVGSTVRLSAKADWLVCAEICLPASGDVALELPVRAQEPTATRWASSIQATRDRLVRPSTNWTLSARPTRDGYALVAQIPADVMRALRAPYFIADSMTVVNHSAEQRVLVSRDTLRMEIVRSAIKSAAPARLQGVVLGDVATGSPGWHIDVELSSVTPTVVAQTVFPDGATVQRTGGANMAVAARVAPTAEREGIVGLLLAMGAALLGGLLLNLMPCVFPVLSVKILSLVERGGADAREGRRHAMVFTVGVLSTFWALAGVLLLLRAGGTQLGWGFQLQSPAVVTVLALVLFALALNLSGVFVLGAGLTRLGAVGGGARYYDSFLTGLMAVVVATPCTAPFMGAALGFALTQSAVAGMAVFTALGLGLALPYIVFASSPQLMRRLPKPGAWLETLKQLLAFPMYATVVWLLWVLGRQAGTDIMSMALLATVLVALTAWLAGRAQYSGRHGLGTMALIAVGVSIVAGGYVVGSQPVEVRAQSVPQGWEPFTVARVEEARREGRAIFVDFTAAWCLSCQVNERVALHSASVERAFVDGNVLLLRADWTSRDPEITKALATFGRSGVPLYVMYPRTAGAAAEVLPAVLTSGIVTDAVTRATAAGAP
ncbi:MAG: thioredoxin family protein [Gemmatimonadaceae bacterium]|nr:thioredoxin family protein [Gemmatimonadaceae bacterium]